jgi:hypothetical protein
MKRARFRKRVYTILGLSALIYTLVGSFVSFTTRVDYFVPPSAYKYDIRNDPTGMGFLFLLTGVPLFLLFLFLERRTNKAERDSED